MEKKELKKVRKQYDALLLSGKKPLKDVSVYVCDKCSRELYVRYKDAGYAPEGLKHKCGGKMQLVKICTEEEASRETKKVFNWVRPSWRMVRRMLDIKPALAYEFLHGRLILRD